MDKSIYFIILDIGINRKKAAQSSGFWKIGEKKELNNEIMFWKSLIQNVRDEARGVDCAAVAFHNLEAITDKYQSPNYRNILSNWTELQKCRFETDLATEQKVCSIMDELLDKALRENKKHNKYEIIRTLHNIPHCMHGANCIQPKYEAISLSSALDYAGLDNEKWEIMCYNLSWEPADIIIHVQGKGIVLKERSVIAYRKDNNKIVAVGTEAEHLKEKDTDNLVVRSPLRQGRVEDFVPASKLFALLFIKAFGKRPILKRPAVVVCAPKGITPVERMAIKDMMAWEVRAGEILIVDTPAEEFIREFSEKSPNEYRKFKIIVGITKDEPERYVEEQLKNTLNYAKQEQIPTERVLELLRDLESKTNEDKGI